MATPTKPSVPTIPLSKVAAELAEKTGMTKKDATGALDDFVGLVVKHLKKGNKVRITGLGILQVRNRPARMGRNPATGEAIKIKASKKVATSLFTAAVLLSYSCTNSVTTPPGLR